MVFEDLVVPVSVKSTVAIVKSISLSWHNHLRPASNNLSGRLG